VSHNWPSFLAQPGFPNTYPNSTGCAAWRFSRSFSITAIRDLKAHGSTTPRSGLGRRDSVFHSQRISHHIHPADHARPAALLSQLSCAPGAARMAVYILLLIVSIKCAVVHRPSVGEAIKTAPWLAYIFCVQNLFHLALPPAIAPTWALAIEEQYYFVWLRWCAGCAGR